MKIDFRRVAGLARALYFTGFEQVHFFGPNFFWNDAYLSAEGYLIRSATHPTTLERNIGSTKEALSARQKGKNEGCNLSVLQAASNIDGLLLRTRRQRNANANRLRIWRVWPVWL